MNGEKLYTLYAELSEEQSCMVDEWDALEYWEQAVWNKLAAVLAV